MDNSESSDNLDLLRQLFLFFICWFGGALLGTLAMQTIAQALNIGDWSDLIEKIQKGMYLDHINIVKIISITGHLCAYTLSSFSFAYLIRRNFLFKYLHLHKSPGFLNIPLIILIMVSAFPLAIWLAYVNANLIPAHFIAHDTLNLEMKLMQMNNIYDFLLNILLIGIVAGFGEELLFRGIILQFVAKYSKNMHLAIWTSAILFSLTHFQPEGFIPRFLMGALMGYLFLWTGTLWASIIGHISFNSAQVFIFYFNGVDENHNIVSKPDFSIIFTFLSLGIFIFACFAVLQLNRKKKLSLESLE